LRHSVVANYIKNQAELTRTLKPSPSGTLQICVLLLLLLLLL